MLDEAKSPVASEAPPPGILDANPATPPRQGGELAAGEAGRTPTKPSRGPRGPPSKAKEKPRPGSAAPVSAAPAAADAPVLADAQKDRSGRPQENAVTARLKKTKMCYFFSRGKCASQNCRYAHSAAELRNPPNLQKTKLCKAFEQDGMCPQYENCIFAHGEAELRVTDGIYKTQMCHFYERGRCLKGDRCNHAHGPEDLRTLPTAAAGGTVAVGVAGGAGPGSAKKPPRQGSPKSRTPASATLDARRPLSPLPLADLLADSVGGQGLSAATAAAPGQLPSPLAPAAMAAAAAGLMSPELSMGFVPPMPPSPPMWNMPWLGNPYGALGSPATPMPCMPPMPSTGSLHSPVPHGMGGLTGGDSSAAVAAAEAWSAAEAASAAAAATDLSSTLLPCDLSERLASLDSVVQDLHADVRAYTAGSPAAGGGAGAAAQPTPQQRHIHRI